ncbi:MAG: [Oscillospiraceae bacterium]|nr:[FeFe] hydrogenase H-cluster maturation GTPase HydF [Oscillospiraceae bacterium]
MGLNDTPSANRVHIGFFGRRNAGKSSLVNAVTGQQLAIVSDTKGTTTDPVYKAMELLPLGPVMIIDTPGFDDEGELGLLRVKKTRQVLYKTDVAVLVIDATVGLQQSEQEMIDLFEKKEIAYIVVYNKSDLLVGIPEADEKSIYVSAEKNIAVHELKERMARLAKTEDTDKKIVGDLLVPGDVVVLVTPIDEAAPKGRLILPQQQTIRDILDSNAVSVVVKENALPEVFEKFSVKPKLVITDSQAFALVNRATPEDIPLTSFSILMSRYKGQLTDAVKGVVAIDQLKDGDTVLISEGCTHHRQCGDIGSVKIPAWLNKYTGKKLNIVTTSGTEFPDDLSPYALVIHCGGCMLNEREMRYRMKTAIDQGVPMTNYGIAISYMNGILKRSVAMLPEVNSILEK